MSKQLMIYHQNDIIDQLCDDDFDPYSGLIFGPRIATLKDENGDEILSEEVIFSNNFNDVSVNIITDKYLANSAKCKETDIRSMFDRVSNTIGGFYRNQESTTPDSQIDELVRSLKYYQINNYFAFNSPVYFNVGINNPPQCSACYILDIEDNMESIMEWIATEAQIFKYGSGAGANGSKLRSKYEVVGNGSGFASGPVSFWKGSDVFAGVIKSGGILRRAAKMFRLDIGHPDCIEGMSVKDREELKISILRDGGLKPLPGREFSDEVFYQNTNFSIGITDEFMNNVLSGGKHFTRKVTTGEVVNEYNAHDLLMEIAEHAWRTGDPGLQFHDTINRANNTPAEGTIDSSNPCSEFLAQPNQSCNLASQNLLKFFRFENGKFIFDYATFKDVIFKVIKAQDLLIDNARYPTDKIANATKYFRALGFGYTNLGALIMCLGFPYDSEIGRLYTSLITSLMTSCANLASIELTREFGVAEWAKKEENIKSVKDRQIFKYNATSKLLGKINDIEDYEVRTGLRNLYDIALRNWTLIVESDVPVRNSQLTLIAPTGTISYIMGSSTFGAEPEFYFTKVKKLSGSDGATVTVINDMVSQALYNLGYSDGDVEGIVNDIKEGIPVEKSAYINKQHISIFDTAFLPPNGTRFISPDGHIMMMAAIQPFIDGAISKTINLPESCTVQDIYDIFIKCWKLDIKAIAVYRDSSKNNQVLTVTDNTEKDVELVKAVVDVPTVDYKERRKMPVDAFMRRHKFVINSTGGVIEGYILAGFYDNGDLGEIFIEGTKFGSTLGGWADSFAIAVSIGLQYGTPLEVFIEKYIHTKFEPCGFTENKDIRMCSSIVDYIFKYLAKLCLSNDDLIKLGLGDVNIDISDDEQGRIVRSGKVSTDAICPKCNSSLTRLGRCLTCFECGWNQGGCS